MARHTHLQPLGCSPSSGAVCCLYHKWADRKGLVYAETIRRLEFSFREASEFLSVFLLLGMVVMDPCSFLRPIALVTPPEL